MWAGGCVEAVVGWMSGSAGTLHPPVSLQAPSAKAALEGPVAPLSQSCCLTHPLELPIAPAAPTQGKAMLLVFPMAPSW